MLLPRLFIPLKLDINQEVTLNLPFSHRLLQVLRLKLHDRLLVFNNTGIEFTATLKSVNKNLATIVTSTSVARKNESPLQIHLGQGISRGEKMDFTIQKAVELGAHCITPLFTEYCNVKLKDERLEKRLHHWQSVAISAAEQSGRCYVPQVLPPQPLATWCSSATGLPLLLDPRAQSNISSINKRPTNVTILIGPEGGLSAEEASLAQQHGFIPITLGPRILRTETAALTVISILQAKWGDL